MKFPYPIPLIKTLVVLESIGEVEVSTVELPPFRSGDRTKYSICLFWDATIDGYPDNEEVTVTFDKQNALSKHAEWCDAAKIARCITEVYQRHTQHMGRN
jgi:hypothetical protein